MTDDVIRIRGARQNNLRGLDLDLPLHELIVVTGVSRLGQVVARVRHRVLGRPAALRRDVLAVRAPVPRPHGQAAGRPHRRHPARDRDRPDEPRAHVALDGRHDDGAQRSREAPVRARRACSIAATAAARCAATTRSRSTRSSRASRRVGGAAARVLVTFTVAGPDEFQPRRDREVSRRARATRASTRARRRRRGRAGPARVRARESRAHRRGARGGAQGRQRPRDACGSPTTPSRRVQVLGASALRALRHRATTTASRTRFSFNSPVGACEQCRGFGRTIGIDYRLVIPDEEKTLAGGAIKPWQTKSNKECQDDLLRYAKQRGVPVDVPWRELTRRAARVGHRRRGLVAAAQVVRRRALLRLARIESLQDARARAAVEVPQLRRLPGVRGRAAQARVAALAARLARRCGRRRRRPSGAFRGASAGARRRGVRRAAGPLDPRPHDAARRAHARVLRARRAAATARRRGRARARRDPEPPALSPRRGLALSHARSAVAHAVGRRGAAHQSDDGARHVARQHAVRARRAERRPASARPRPHRRRAHEAARRRQHAARRRARRAGHARGRPHHRHGARARAAPAAHVVFNGSPADARRATANR